MTSKPRAPRNRTLTLTAKETARFKKLARQAPTKLTATDLRDQVFCDDFYQVVERLPAKSINLLILDPPYNLTKDYGEVKFQRRSMEEYEVWLEKWFAPLMKALTPTASVYVCCDWRTSVSVYQVMSRYLHVKNRITWEREKGRGANANWKNCSEDIWFATVDKARYTFNVDAVKLKRKVLAPYTTTDGKPKDWKKTSEGNFRLTHPSNLWTDISIPFWSMPENTDHPTQKPEKLLAKLILASSQPGDLVFDPFMGSGTTAVVARKLQRHFSGVEVNPEFHAWTLKRLESAVEDTEIQGYAQGVFWERNSGGSQGPLRE